MFNRADIHFNCVHFLTGKRLKICMGMASRLDGQQPPPPIYQIFLNYLYSIPIIKLSFCYTMIVLIQIVLTSL